MVRHPTYRPITHPIFLCRDTVQSVGLIPRHLPFCGSNNIISHFRHALSLDERRVKFIPSFCTSGGPECCRDVPENSEAIPENSRRNRRRRIEEPTMSEAEYEVRVNALTGSETDVEEVFFAGVHCGKFRFYAQRTHYLQIPFQMLGVDLW